MQPRTQLPVVEPIIAQSKKEAFNDQKWSFEFKYDGYRGLLHIEEDKAFFISKKKKHMARFDPLAHRIASQLDARSVILDGEIVVFDESSRPKFLDLMMHRKEPQYVTFDILWLDGMDLRTIPLIERRKFLSRLVPKDSFLISRAFTLKSRGKEMFEFMCEHDLEGVIAKRFRDAYASNTTWFKIKNEAYSQVSGRSKFFRKK